ncbi:hypothetical protein CC77DRAFT_199975 [Alternaria alternata]|uniref:Uncharacterized protein n=1 Tax=Alternaria alternata TaxID=5599 RepID=A0A177DFN3_ALTAL|nr:hypothetical protein CC77DRAFT_199975 [Alternaria alternata]OAG18555.1 hypothetical protein CC77DRAFT_199975 [Alternaria alternata]
MRSFVLGAGPVLSRLQSGYPPCRKSSIHVTAICACPSAFVNPAPEFLYPYSFWEPTKWHVILTSPGRGG